MKESVQETECTHCIHRVVCSFKEDYLKVLEKLKDCDFDDHFEVKLHCNCHEYIQTKTTTNLTYDNSGSIIWSNGRIIKEK